MLSCAERKDSENQLIIFHAGSLSVPVKAISEAFAKENPETKFFPEADGSRKSARKISELNRNCDIMASADEMVIYDILIPGYANWNIRFAGNEMIIAYTRKSRFSEIITPENWPNILLKPEVAFGRSEPDNDPCGYRTVLLAKLAEEYFDYPGLTEKILQKNREHIRPKEVDLLALLESGTLDYVFIYKSVAIQHKLPYISLPDSLNLSKPELNNWYATATTEVSGKSPKEKTLIKGEAIVYSLTIPHNSPNKELAEKWVEFLVSPEKGGKILLEKGHTLITPSSSEWEKLPESLKKKVIPG